jgi:hypothetical protein
MIFVAHNAGGANFNMANAIAQIWYDYLPAGSNIDVQPISPELSALLICCRTEMGKPQLALLRQQGGQ